MNLPRSYKTKRHNKKCMDTRSAKKLRHGRVYMLFSLYKNLPRSYKAFLPQKSPAKAAKVLLTMLANVVYYT